MDELSRFVDTFERLSRRIERLEIAASRGRGWVPIDSGNINAAFLTITFPPSGWERIRLHCVGRVNDGGNARQIWARPNGHTGADYLGEMWETNGAGTDVITSWSADTFARVCEWGSVFGSRFEVTFSKTPTTGLVNVAATAGRSGTTAATRKTFASEGRVLLPAAVTFSSVEIGRVAGGTIEGAWTLEGFKE